MADPMELQRHYAEDLAADVTDIAAADLDVYALAALPAAELDDDARRRLVTAALASPAGQWVEREITRTATAPGVDLLRHQLIDSHIRTTAGWLARDILQGQGERDRRRHALQILAYGLVDTLDCLFPPFTPTSIADVYVRRACELLEVSADPAGEWER